MEKHGTTLMFVTYVATSAGTTMANQLKKTAREHYNDTIIEESQADTIKEELEHEANLLSIMNPRWKRSKISLSKNISYGEVDICWLYIDNEAVLTMKKANYNYAINKTQV